MRFKNRRDAGKRLAERLAAYAGKDTIIYALPRGGVVLGREIAQKLDAQLDLVITRKIGRPDDPEYAVCAVTETGALLCEAKERDGLPDHWLSHASAKEQEEAKRRRRVYTHGAQRTSARGKTAIIVDDGIATGLTIRAAVREIRADGPERLVVAVPVAPHDVVLRLSEEADDLVVLENDPGYLGAVSAYYDDFTQVTDEEVVACLEGR